MFEIEIWDNNLKFDTDGTIFSPVAADKGTLAMLRNTVLNHDTRLLDLGCGCGIVGIAAAKVIGEDNVFMVDISSVAVEYSRSNAVVNGVPRVTIVQGDGVCAFKDMEFSLILSNPPYHTDFSVAKAFIEHGFKSLSMGGRMIMVVKRLDWYKNKMASVFGGVKIVEEDGYYILSSEKRLQAGKKAKIVVQNKKHMKKLARSQKK